jgi:hypothetical protein
MKLIRFGSREVMESNHGVGNVGFHRPSITLPIKHPKAQNSQLNSGAYITAVET